MYIQLPTPDKSIHNKVYSISVNDVVVRKIVGGPKALRYSKWRKYDNFHSSVSITNVLSGKVIKTFGG